MWMFVCLGFCVLAGEQPDRLAVLAVEVGLSPVDVMGVVMRFEEFLE